MSDFKERLENEQTELDIKLRALTKFNNSEKSQAIDPIQKSLLVIQASAMSTYLECLNERLTRL